MRARSTVIVAYRQLRLLIHDQFPYGAELPQLSTKNKESKKTLIRWIKDHGGILGNCRVNSLAQSTTKCSMTDYTLDIKPNGDL